MCLDIHKTPVVFICTKGEIMKTNKKDFKSGFTLLELLVVVLIIGILASIALPQYEMAVTKAKVASIFPIMRRWSDAYAEYYLQHGSYVTEDDESPDAETLGVSWPSDWSCDESGNFCENEIFSCGVNESVVGDVVCTVFLKKGDTFATTDSANIQFYQSNTLNEDAFRYTTRQCLAARSNVKGNKLCKALGGKLIDEDEGVYAL